MHLDQQRYKALQSDKAELLKAIAERAATVGGDERDGGLRSLRDRLQAVNEELIAMEFATEVERQKDA